ncbi:MAG: hypothetical protein S4CHLAM123_07160 [Chlamydiales bacterium]|nr:hypothetical protein [Chlamydiales bacterium]
MKKIVLILLLGMIVFSSLYAQSEINNHFSYGSVGTIGECPALGGGFHMQNRGEYFDMGCDISGKLGIGIAQARAIWLLYPTKKRRFHVGFGAGFLYERKILPKGSVLLDAVVGYQWQTRKERNLFLQVEGMVFKVDCYMFVNYDLRPALTLGIGF